MCLISLAWRHHAEFPLIVAANRDEFRERPAQTLHMWPDDTGIIAGRDIQAGGTWMGLTRHGRFAAITNYREPGRTIDNAPTRGHLVSDFLQGTAKPQEYMSELQSRAQAYNGFNLLACNERGMSYYGNRAEGMQELDAGIYGLSNAVLNTPWPKVESLKAEIAETVNIKGVEELTDKLFNALADESIAKDELLPETGVGIELERRLSARFIGGGKYGTRASTVLLIDKLGRAYYSERHYRVNSDEPIVTKIEIQLTPP